MSKQIILRLSLLTIFVISGLILFLKTNPVYDASVTDINASCQDTDGGRNYDERGTVSYLKRDDNTRFTFTDHCNLEDDQTSYTLTEFYCDGNIYKYRKTRCSSGCSKGVCIGDGRIFRTLDSNADGQMSLQEAAPAASRVWGMVGKKEGDIGYDAVFDENGDSIITSDDAILYLDAIRQVLVAKDRTLLEAYLIIDANHDGSLTVFESAPLVSTTQKDIRTGKAKRMYDIDQNGNVDLTDWKLLHEAARLFLATEDRREFEAFLRMDTNQDGSITRAESDAVIGDLTSRLGTKSGGARYEQPLDADEDGTVSPKDAYVFMQTGEKWQID